MGPDSTSDSMADRMLCRHHDDHDNLLVERVCHPLRAYLEESTRSTPTSISRGSPAGGSGFGLGIFEVISPVTFVGNWISNISSGSTSQRCYYHCEVSILLGQRAKE